MTDVQLPLQHQNHQKGMNGKYSPKNLEIRGFSGSANTNANQLVSVSESKATNSNAIGSATKKSLKLIEKSAPSTNFQVLRFNPNNEFGTLVSVIDVNPNITNKTRTSFNTSNNSSSSNNNNNKNSNPLLQNQLNSELIQINSAQSLNLLNSMNTNLSASFLAANLTNTNNTNANAATTTTTNIFNNNNTNFSHHTNQITPNATSQHHSHHATTSNNRNSNQFWNDESNSGWTGTGVMSDRSSVYSIDDGDFDREASRKVNSQLREIEAILYEQNSTHSSQQSIECNEWLEKFPHLRILGKQIFRDECLGDNSSLVRSSLQSLQISSLKALSSNFTNVTSSVSSNLSINNSNNKLELIASTSPINDNNNTNTSESKYFRRRENSDLNTQLLNVYGTSMPIRSVKEDDLASSSSNEFTSFEEETFDQEGIYEELLAYDNQEEEYLFEHNKRLNLSKRRRHGLPPITPKAAMKDLVLNFLFDHVWCELIDWSSDTIKAYAKTVSEDFIFADDSACKTPRLVSTPNLDENSFCNNNNINLTNNATNLPDSTKSTNNSSPSYSSLNNPYPTNETITSSHITPTSISINNNTTSNNTNNIINNNNNTNNAIATATNVTKANIIQLKLFDSQLNQSNLYPIQSYTPSLLTRDNSYLYKNNNNLQNDTNTTNNNNNNNNDTLGDLMTKDLLQIKQLNRNGSSTNSTNLNNNNSSNNASNLKALNPIILGSQSRVSSGNRRQYQMNYYRKRYSSIEMGGTNTNASSTPVDKNIVIHGAGLVKPSSLGQNANEDAKSASNVPFNAAGNNNTLQMSAAITNSRSTTSTSHAYNHQMVNDENAYESDYNDYQTMYENGESSIDEINLINQSNQPLNAKQLNVVSSTLANYHSNHSHLNYFGFHQHNNANNFQPLPPIENSLTLKPIRISSANVNNNSGLKQIKERNERPMTSTATRFDLNGIPAINKRSTTPSGLTSATKSALKKFNNTRQSPDDSIFLNNFLSTKSFNFLLNNNNSNNNNNNNNNNSNSGSNITTSSNSTQNRRNSIKDSHSLTRVYR